MRRKTTLALFLTGCASTALLAQDRFPDQLPSYDAQPPARTTPSPSTPAPTPAPQTRSAPIAPPQANSQRNDDARIAGIASAETEDFGVAPTSQLHGDPMHAPTPKSVPGGKVISTQALNQLYQQAQGTFIVFDVLGGERGLPNAQNAQPAGWAGTFEDQNQQNFAGYLQQVTRGKADMPLVFYCQSTYCWLSYNACLRAIKLGYTNVMWYRGGIEAWEKAGLPTYPRQM